MIKYSLECKKCSLLFDSWFSSSKEYERLKKKKLLSCLECNSNNVEKTLMAPKIIGKRDKIKTKNYKDIKNTIIRYQKFIKENFKYVGKNFAFEARSIHYNKKKAKGIYGTASLKEINELKEEGIESNIIPWVNRKDN